MLKSDDLDNSPIVANNAMNRERGFKGTNSYTKDLRYRLEGFLKERTRSPRHTVRWLDLCTGRGKALIEAAEIFDDDKLDCLGVDLVDFFDEIPAHLNASVCFDIGSLPEWEAPMCVYDLITCCHGLHYVGDKLKTIEKAVSWLKNDGLFIANIDPSNVKLSDGLSLDHILREEGFSFSKSTRVFSKTGYDRIDFPYEYVGADDEVGPNYTGQPAVTSHYKRTSALCNQFAPLHPRFRIAPTSNTCELEKYHGGTHRVKSKVW